jgi:eukaryotic-like serine/threonine-protein kinase
MAGEGEMTSAGLTAETSQVIAGRYTVERLLGEGGMGAVYKVRDADGRSLALKRLRIRSAAHASSATLLFQREFYWLAQLAHPRIIEVYDYGVDEEGAYYTMELLDGEDLREGGDRRQLFLPLADN